MQPPSFSAADEIKYDQTRGSIDFKMIVKDRSIKCSVSAAALNRIACIDTGDKTQVVRAFSNCRFVIGLLVEDKLQAGLVEPDGSVLIDPKDVG